jgi:hypothetical protein
MQPSVIVRRFMLVSGLGELVPIVLDTSLAKGLRALRAGSAHGKTVREHDHRYRHSHTYLVDETSRRWSCLGGVPSHRGRARRRVVVITARLYVLGIQLSIHTRPTDRAWVPPPGAYRARAGSRTEYGPCLLEGDMRG